MIYHKYKPETDFLRVRDFLVESFSLTQKPLNWKLERWNYSRYFITPMLATDGVGDTDLSAVDAAVRLWNQSTALWENQAGQIAGLVNIEHAHRNHTGWGEFFCQHHPDYSVLLPELLAYAEEHLYNQKKKQVFVPVYDYDEDLISVLKARGYQKNKNSVLWDAIYPVPCEVSKPILPDGYVIQSMADEGSDIEKRRKVFGVGFNHPDPIDWPSRFAYESLQQAPDYRADLDVYVVAPDGEYGSFCIGWWDETNKIASLEPVGTAPELRRKGLAHAVVRETINRLTSLGAERVFVGSDQKFYLSIGFELALPAHHWVKEMDAGR